MANRQIAEDIARMREFRERLADNPVEARAFLIRAGMMDPDGRISENYPEWRAQQAADQTGTSQLGSAVASPEPINYDDCTVADITCKLRIPYRAENLFPSLIPGQPSAWLAETLQRGITAGISNDQSRIERIISPVLLELSSANQDTFAVHSGRRLDVNASLPFRGTCDFLLSHNRVQDFLVAPLFLAVNLNTQEKADPLAAVMAQLLAAGRFNETAGYPRQLLFGCFITGAEWRFLKYEGLAFTLDATRYYLAQLPALLGALQAIVDATRAKAGETVVSSAG